MERGTTRGKIPACSRTSTHTQRDPSAHKPIPREGESSQVSYGGEKTDISPVGMAYGDGARKGGAEQPSPCWWGCGTLEKGPDFTPKGRGTHQRGPPARRHRVGLCSSAMTKPQALVRMQLWVCCLPRTSDSGQHGAGDKMVSGDKLWINQAPPMIGVGSRDH